MLLNFKRNTLTVHQTAFVCCIQHYTSLYWTLLYYIFLSCTELKYLMINSTVIYCFVLPDLKCTTTSTAIYSLSWTAIYKILCIVLPCNILHCPSLFCTVICCTTLLIAKYSTNLYCAKLYYSTWNINILIFFVLYIAVFTNISKLPHVPDQIGFIKILYSKPFFFSLETWFTITKR